MAFILEDGIGRREANSYAHVDFAKDYAAERGRTEFASATDAQIEIWLIRGTDYIEQRWGSQYPGTGKLKANQGLLFPRLLAYDRDGTLLTGVPRALCIATVEMGLRATKVARLMPDPPSPFATEDSSGNTTNITTGELQSETTQVEGIRRVRSFAHSGIQSRRIVTSTIVGGVSQQEYPQVLQILRPILTGGGDGFGTMTIRN